MEGRTGTVLPQRSILATQHRIERAETNCPGAKKCMAVTLKKTRIGRGALAAGLSVAIGLGATACNRDYDVGYVYMTAAKANPGLVNAYKVDYQSGFLNPLEDSPIPSGGRNPVGLVAAPNGKHIYVLNHDDSTVVWVAIGTDGKLYPQVTYNTTGSFPTAAAIDPGGKFLYVTFTYQLGFTTALPGPGGVTVFPINADNSLGTPSTVNVGRNPMGIVANSKFAYVIDQDSATTLNLLGFSVNSANGFLTPLPGVIINPGNVVSTGFASGSLPAGILEDSGLAHLYVADQSTDLLIGYSVAASGIPSQVGAASTGAAPAGMAIDPSGKYLYIANTTAGTIGGYTFGANGQPITSTVAQSVQAGTGTTCVTIIGAPTDANTSHAVYLYASNSLSNTATGEQMNPADGSLKQIQGTPFSGSTLPSCLVSVPSFPR
jgi:6-phosphogluconolactonase